MNALNQTPSANGPTYYDYDDSRFKLGQPSTLGPMMLTPCGRWVTVADHETYIQPPAPRMGFFARIAAAWRVFTSS